MKRYGNLYPKIITIDNLYKAAKKAEKGKRNLYYRFVGQTALPLPFFGN